MSHLFRALWMEPHTQFLLSFMSPLWSVLVFLFCWFCRYYNRLRSLVKDPRHDCVLFANEFQEYSYCPREKGESPEKWQTRSVLSEQPEPAALAFDLVLRVSPDLMIHGVFITFLENYSRFFSLEVFTLGSGLSLMSHKLKSTRPCCSSELFHVSKRTVSWPESTRARSRKSLPTPGHKVDLTFSNFSTTVGL